jgi:hypothetical protein
MSKTSSKEKLCVSCNSYLKGEYCHNCGEKVVANKDFTFKKLFEQAFDSFTHIDSKLFKSFAYLLFKPGRLSSDYVIGKRKNFMKPFQIFILINILFFIFLSNVDVFRKPSSWWFKQSTNLGFSVKDRVHWIGKVKNIAVKEVMVLYDTESNKLAKGFVIILIPVISLIMALLNIKKKLQTGKHLIFSVHIFSFMLLFILVWSEFMRLMYYLFDIYFWRLPIIIVLITYLTISIRNFYKDKWLWSVVKGLISFALIIISIAFYRSVISILALNLI